MPGNSCPRSICRQWILIKIIFKKLHENEFAKKLKSRIKRANKDKYIQHSRIKKEKKNTSITC